MPLSSWLTPPLSCTCPARHRYLPPALTPTTTTPPPAFAAWQVFAPWVLLYIAAYFFQGGSGGGVVGIISNLRSYLWIPIAQDSYR